MPITYDSLFPYDSDAYGYDGSPVVDDVPNEIQVTIATITFNANLQVGSSFYLLRNTAELFSTLTTRRTDRDRQSGHGTRDSLSWYGPRIIPFEGEIHASSQSERKEMEDALKSILALSVDQSYDDDDGYKLLLITDENGIEKQIYAKIVEPPLFELIEEAMPESRAFRFVMYANDPTLFAQLETEENGPESYSTTTFTIQDGGLPTFEDGDLPTIQDDTGNEMTVTNEGTFGTPPVITLHGPTANPIITNTTTGKVMDFSNGLELEEDETLTVNVATQTIIKTSVGVDSDASAFLTPASDWIFIAPGANVLTLTDDSSDALESQMDVEFRSAWI